MYIKSIVLDGFKSYGNRVEITGFDPAFNAITGLNGTGKSNILDSICFVLGITNLSNVRAGSLQELIYKHGQAGITKATVSITFDNTDKAQQPIGYDSKEITVTRQVVMGGKNKYLINGINVQNKRVSDLFCSVQLNVNNPHFLIMQGRITKVLNMKPPEILSMVEEAAGTRMYEAKKQAAQKTIEKKDAKLKELNDIIKEDIAPKLQKLQDERAQFQEYQKVVRELENLTKLYVAFKYVTAEEKTKEADGKVHEVRDAVKGKQDTIKENEAEMKNIDKKVAEINKKLDEESGSILKELESELQGLEKTEACANSAFKDSKEAVTAHEKRARLLERALNDDSTLLNNKKTQLEQVTAQFGELRAASERAEAQLAEAQRRFLAASSGQGLGAGAGGGGADSLQDRLMAAKQEASEASTRISQSTMEKKHAETRVRTLQKEFDSNSAQYRRDQNTIDGHQAQIDQLQVELSRMNFDEARNTELKESIRNLQSVVRQKRDAVDTLSARLQRCEFKYSPPPNFDRTRVAGTVCKLIEVKDPVYCTALETAAGGKLYHVVVDTETTSKLLLQRGNLQSRTTIIPLNKISATTIDAHTVRAAQEVGGGPEHVQLALDLVRFEARLRPAMAWVFGSTLVCRDLETAKRVTFHPRVRRRCVTLDGDVFDPAGTLSGGAAQQGGSVLAAAQELRRLEGEAGAAEAALAACAAELQASQRLFDDYHAALQRYELMQHELGAVRARVAATPHAQLHDEIRALQLQVKELTEAVERDKIIQKETAAKAKDLEDQVKDIRSHREREYKKAEEDLKAAKEAAGAHGASWTARSQELETLRLEVAELELAVQSCTQQLTEAQLAAAALQSALGAARAQHAAAAEAVKEMQTRIKRQKEEISSRSGEIRKLLAKKEDVSKTNRETELKIKELDYKIKELQVEADECQKKIKSLESEYPWIQSEREYFGAAGGMYDFGARQAHVAGQRVRQLSERRDKLARGLNARAHTLLTKEEEQYQDLMRKKRIVEADRAKLVQTMEELDEKKRSTLIAACEQVNRDFGSIFSMLLSGAEAKLKPPDGMTVLDGLEVRVGFSGAWKESLGELSGGQRSLVALSLVLAMLLFKPAPLYILDEVDAALDLSHTQNIGRMLREHFRHSQFIIVSLKDGMFNNANVLFRTRFVDGMSSVQRTVNSRR